MRSARAGLKCGLLGNRHRRSETPTYERGVKTAALGRLVEELPRPEVRLEVAPEEPGPRRRGVLQEPLPFEERRRSAAFGGPLQAGRAAELFRPPTSRKLKAC